MQFAFQGGDIVLFNPLSEPISAISSASLAVQDSSSDSWSPAAAVPGEFDIAGTSLVAVAMDLDGAFPIEQITYAFADVFLVR